jgi:hypothetical protein
MLNHNKGEVSRVPRNCLIHHDPKDGVTFFRYLKGRCRADLARIDLRANAHSSFPRRKNILQVQSVPYSTGVFDSVAHKHLVEVNTIPADRWKGARVGFEGPFVHRIPETD